MIRLKNGIIAMPKSNIIPIVPAGYMVKKNNPFVFLPIIPECTARLTIMAHDNSCGCMKPITFCKKDDPTIRIEKYPTCHGCKTPCAPLPKYDASQIAEDDFLNEFD